MTRPSQSLDEDATINGIDAAGLEAYSAQVVDDPSVADRDPVSNRFQG